MGAGFKAQAWGVRLETRSADDRTHLVAFTCLPGYHYKMMISIHRIQHSRAASNYSGLKYGVGYPEPCHEATSPLKLSPKLKPDMLRKELNDTGSNPECQN